MDQPLLFDIPEHITKPKWSEYATSISDDEAEIIRWIMRLYTGSRPFDLDPTYSIGRLWTGLPQPRLKFDLMPQTPDCMQANVTALPLPDASIDSVLFDPPFVVAPNPAPGIIRDRFSNLANPKELYRFYLCALGELHRVLRPDGILAFKCQDMISGSKQYLSHVEIVNMAKELHYICEDLFVLVRTNVLWSPNMVNQQHARKRHCYYLVFRKRR